MSKMAAYIQAGEKINYTNGSGTAIAYGDVVNLTSCIGVAADVIAAAATGVLDIFGVFQMAAVTNASFAVGDVLFWDPIALNLTKVSTSNVPAGICVATKATSTAVADVQIGRTMITLDNTIEDGEITAAKVSAPVVTHHLIYQVEDLGANADITARKILTVPTGANYTLVSAKISGKAAASGVDASNTAVFTLTDGTNTIVTKTFDDDPAFPDANTPTSLGTLNATHKVLDAAESLCLTVTTGTTADLPAFDLELVYTVSEDPA
ncbi:MAG: capsid cement protein [Negativicutes bacterium]